MDRVTFEALKINDFKQFLPQEWCHSDSYETEPYVLVKLSDSSQEYAAVCKHFQMTPKCIKRIQHPTSVLLYLVNEEYRQAKGNACHEVYKFLNLNSSDVETYLKNNCDERYHPGNASLETESDPVAGKNTIMVKENLWCDNDISRYPMYLVEF